MSIKWTTVQPLTGGMTIGAEQAIGNPPEFLISQPVPHNDHLKGYYKSRGIDVPFYESAPDYTDCKKCKMDIVLGVPVCAGLSMQNATAKGDNARGADAIQNNNMYQMAEMVLSTYEPKVYLFENAPALYTASGRAVLDKLLVIARKHGYSMTAVKTDTFLHGLPQHRQRTFAYFWKSEKAPFVNYYRREPVSLKEHLALIPTGTSLHDLPVREDIENDLHFNFLEGLYDGEWRQAMLDACQPTAWQLLLNTDQMHDYIDWCKSNDREDGIKLAEHILHKKSQGKSFWDNSLVFHDDYVNAVVGKNMRRRVHPTENRFFTIRELLWLMGHPMNYELFEAKKNYNHIAQNVPVCTARDWTAEAVKFVKGQLELSNDDFVMQNNTNQTVDVGHEDCGLEAFLD